MTEKFIRILIRKTSRALDIIIKDTMEKNRSTSSSYAPSCWKEKEEMHI